MQQWEYLFVQCKPSYDGRYSVIFANGKEIIRQKDEDAFSRLMEHGRYIYAYRKMLGSYFAQIGNQGWELVMYDESDYIFKRPIP